ncbi:MAG TPA: metal ABC transporter substrate-binding protein, partial [Nitrospiria bacterium]|nr:metal ABC transporter substrate-binding protein [Nitrospiria bacterium]
IITQHPAWPYFARRFGFRIAGNIVTQVGTEPSARQLENLIKKIRKENIRAIVSEPQLSDKIPKMLSDETGIPRVILSPLPGNLPGTETYLKLTEYNVRQLIEALKK